MPAVLRASYGLHRCRNEAVVGGARGRNGLAAPPIALMGRELADERILVVIPARLGSERLPEKPLYRLAGRPLIEWVWRRVRSFGLADALVVATDAERIAAACRDFGASVVLTAAHHDSGTDRIAETVQRTEFSTYDVVVNVQGDEPFIDEAHILGALEQVRAGHDVGTVGTPLREVTTWRDPAVVKVVRRRDGAALYFSRAPIPHRRAGDPDQTALSSPLYLRHIGVYAYRRDALLRWPTLPASALEAEERLEQLRALEAGLSIGVGVVPSATRGVDTEADARAAEQRLLATIEQGRGRDQALAGTETNRAATERNERR